MMGTNSLTKVSKSNKAFTLILSLFALVLTSVHASSVNPTESQEITHPITPGSSSSGVFHNTTNTVPPAKIKDNYITHVGSVSTKSKFSLNELRPLYLGEPSGVVHDFTLKVYQYNPSEKTYPAVNYLPTDKQKRILVTGGAGFVGSHLVDRLMKMGHLVTVVDNFFTGNKRYWGLI
jgi:NADPH:quinone reductase-like Zn-dependent oxidoreductase